MSEEVVIKEPLRKMADALSEVIDIDAQGNAIIADASGYEQTLADQGLDLATVKKVQKHNANFVNAVTLAIGEKAIGFFPKHPDVTSVTGELKLGSDRFNIQIDRSADVPDGKGGTVLEYGVVAGSYRTQAGAKNSDYRAVRSHLSALAMAALME